MAAEEQMGAKIIKKKKIHNFFMILLTYLLTLKSQNGEFFQNILKI
jgi:hypothetical protein